VPQAKGILLVQSAGPSGVRLGAALAERPELQVIGEVTTTREAVAAAARLKPSTVVMDVGLADVAGNGVLKSLRAVAPDARVVMHAWAADVEGPGSRRWAARLVQVVLDQEHAPVLEARVELPDEARSVTVARGLLTDLLTQWDLESLVPSAALLLSELVANAVRHVPGPCALEVTHHADVVRVAVADTGSGMPDLQVLSTSEIGGWGLHIVTALATAWGVDQLDDGGKLVWAELRTLTDGAA
jgi:anti-sigma regulatory factor (Ser/Thr protein kinase)